MTAVLLDVFVPFPSFPKSLLPQQYAVPSWVTPQVLLSPMSTEMKVWPPTTGSGVKCASVSVEPLPSAPLRLLNLPPQQYAVPPTVTPQVLFPAMSSDANSSPLVAATADC